MAVRKISALSRAAAPLLVALPWVLGSAAASAQDHAVVQPLPPPAAADLSASLQRLARSPADFDALIAAGRASLAIGDVDAATGFFGRADAVRPGDARVKAGLGSANLKSDRPIEALQLFDQAQAAAMRAQQEALLRATLDDLDSQMSNVKTMAEAWSRGDTGSLEKLLLTEMKTAPDLYARLLVERNANWVASVETCVTQKTSCFVVVGAAHLIGPDSLVAMLRKKGYTVEQH